MQTAKIKHVLKPEGFTNSVSCLAVSPDGKYAVSGESSMSNDTKEGYSIMTWDLTAGTQIKTVNAGKDGITCIAYSNDGNTIVTGDYAGTVKYFDAKTLNEMVVMRYDNEISAIDFSDDDGILIYGSYKSYITVFDRKKMIPVKSESTFQRYPTSISISPGSKYAAIAFRYIGGGGKININSHDFLWMLDGNNGFTRIKSFPEIGDNVYHVKFSPDGRYLYALVSEWVESKGKDIQYILKYDTAESVGTKINSPYNDEFYKMASFYRNSFAFLPKTNRALTQQKKIEQIDLWNYETGRIEKSFLPPEDE